MNLNVLGIAVVLISMLLFSVSINGDFTIVDYIVLFLIDMLNFAFGLYVGTRHER